jgi:hypothetical protein
MRRGLPLQLASVALALCAACAPGLESARFAEGAKLPSSPRLLAGVRPQQQPEGDADEPEAKEKAPEKEKAPPPEAEQKAAPPVAEVKTAPPPAERTPSMVTYVLGGAGFVAMGVSLGYGIATNDVLMHQTLDIAIFGAGMALLVLAAALYNYVDAP